MGIQLKCFYLVKLLSCHQAILNLENLEKITNFEGWDLTAIAYKRMGSQSNNFLINYNVAYLSSFRFWQKPCVMSLSCNVFFLKSRDKNTKTRSYWLRKAFDDPLLAIYLRFYSATFPLFTNYNLFIQKYIVYDYLQ